MTRSPLVLQRCVAGLLALEALYTLGLTVLLSRFSAALGALDNGEGPARLGSVAVGLAGVTTAVVLALAAVGLWRNWSADTDRRRRTASNITLALAVALHAGVALLAAARGSWAAVAVCALVLGLIASTRQPTRAPAA